MPPHGKSILVVMLAGTLAGCAVQLVEENDPRIEEGLSEYQTALEEFRLRVTDAYERCAFYRGLVTEIERRDCTTEPSASAQCEVQVAEDLQSAGFNRDEMCDSASYRGNLDGFYFPEEARLRVLVTRARILDSSGACALLSRGVARLAETVTDETIREWIGNFEGGNSANCTSLQLEQLQANHDLLRQGHQRLDERDRQDGSGPEQAKAFLPTAYETLVQSISIALFIERAKRRGGE